MQTTKPETAQQRPTGARMALLMLLYFIKIGAFTFGSGWSIIAQMEREFVDERGWMTKSDLLELIAVGKSLPGIMVANITLLFGYQMAGVLGGICAAIGLCIPAVVTLTIVTAIYDAIKDNYWVWSALKGVQCAVAPIIGGAAMYEAFMDKADSLYLTEIDDVFPADTFFPEFDRSQWRICEREEHTAEEGKGHDFAFVHYVRK